MALLNIFAGVGVAGVVVVAILYVLFRRRGY